MNMTKTPLSKKKHAAMLATLARGEWEDFEKLPSQFVAVEAMRLLGMTAHDLAAVMAVDWRTVNRWTRDPAEMRSGRYMPTPVRRIIFWMLRPGRPKEWATEWTLEG